MSERSDLYRAGQRAMVRRVSAHALRAIAFLGCFALGACSDVPNWANPVDWYKGAESAVFGPDESEQPAPKSDEAQTAAEDIKNKPVPGEGEPFPNLASVPQRPTSVTPPGERKEITEALVSDREHAHYVEEPTPSRPALLPGADAVAAPRPPVTTEPSPLPPPPAAAQPTPPPSGSQQLAQTPPPAPRPAPTPAPSPPEVQAPPPPVPAAPAAPAEPGAPRSLGRLVIGPSGEVKQALPGDGSALPNTAALPPLPSAPSYAGLQPDAVVLFNDGATQLSPQQRQGLRPIAQAASDGARTVRVVGHASPARNPNSTAALVANYKASWDRAQAVAEALMRLGVPASRIRVEADTSPESAPIVASLPSGDAGLRRADIFLQ